ncbi:MAG: hypothetical protein PHQ95_04910 [Candidatus Gracilibacteria bacterium]|nr:hypothetical protein [Candidatus Gracilibacteria bacterium]
MKELHNLITNTTSLVGYIAVLMFVGAYLGGDKNSALDPVLLKGSIGEHRGFQVPESHRPIIITIDGRQYEAMVGEEVNQKPVFTY